MFFATIDKNFITISFLHNYIIILYIVRFKKRDYLLVGWFYEEIPVLQYKTKTVTQYADLSYLSKKSRLQISVISRTSAGFLMLCLKSSSNFFNASFETWIFDPVKSFVQWLGYNTSECSFSLEIWNKFDTEINSWKYIISALHKLQIWIWVAV